MRLYISIGTGTVDKLFDKILDNVLGSSRFHNYSAEQRSIFALGDEGMRIQYEEQMSEAHFKRNTVPKKMNSNGFHT
ncbi:hypothetical protein T12_13553 [Trichinella patagoniensis]|uniref:Uncharacterized protein n=1 Tax=Trichinella patagoniensis TaxID=990121 RepID=A0A0V1ABE3_9BILA|nr:hypothetical protein T12_13553 [Trichinella patagoniensis]